MSQTTTCPTECTVNQTEAVTRPPQQVTPRADLWESQDAYVLSVEMPGVSENDADLTLEKNVLTIRGTMQRNVPDGYQSALGDCRPRQYERSFRLSDAIDGQALDATVKNGVLTVRMPKARHAVAQKITVRPA